MPGEITTKTLRDMRGALIGWTIGLVLYGAVLMAMYPSVRASGMDLEAYWESFPPEMRALFGDAASLATVEGFLKTEVLSYLPLLLAIIAIGRAAHAVAGEEEERTIDLLLAQPVERWRVLLEKVAAITVVLFAVTTALGLTLALTAAAAGVGDVPLWRIVVAAWLAVPATLVFAGIALVGSSVFHRRRQAVAVATVVAVVSYLLNGLGRLVDWLDPLRPLSVFYHYEQADPLAGDGSVLAFVVLVAAAAALMGAAVWAFERKDVHG